MSRFLRVRAWATIQNDDQQALPNLAPFVPPDWSDIIVVHTLVNDGIDTSPLYTDQKLVRKLGRDQQWKPPTSPAYFIQLCWWMVC